MAMQFMSMMMYDVARMMHEERMREAARFRDAMVAKEAARRRQPAQPRERRFPFVTFFSRPSEA